MNLKRLGRAALAASFSTTLAFGLVHHYLTRTGIAYEKQQTLDQVCCFLEHEPILARHISHLQKQLETIDGLVETPTNHKKIQELRSQIQQNPAPSILLEPLRSIQHDPEEEAFGDGGYFMMGELLVLGMAYYAGKELHS